MRRQAASMSLRHCSFSSNVTAQERRNVDDGDGALAHGGVMVSRRLAQGHIRQRPHGLPAAPRSGKQPQRRGNVIAPRRGRIQGP